MGGAGPVASNLLYSTIIEICQKQYGSNDYHEFPEIILESYPFTRGDRENIRQDIALCFAKLKRAGAELFSIASHSFHGCLPDVSAMTFVSLVQESLAEASARHISRPLIIAAQATIDLKLYEQKGFQCVYPSEQDQKLVQTMIREIAGGVVTNGQRLKLAGIIESFQKQSLVDGVIIACTELPLIHRKFPLSGFVELPIIDTVEVLAQRLLVLSQSTGL